MLQITIEGMFFPSFFLMIFLPAIERSSFLMIAQVCSLFQFYKTFITGVDPQKK
jgi:hypothetical protein